MADTLQYELVSPERMLASGECETVEVPGVQGDLGVMANHAPFLTTMRPGFVTFRESGSATRYFVAGGFAEISDNTVTILAEEAKEADEVSRDYVEERRDRAQKAYDDAADENKLSALQTLNDYNGLLQVADFTGQPQGGKPLKESAPAPA